MYFFLGTLTGWPSNLKMRLFPKGESPSEKESFPWGGHYLSFCCAHHSWGSQNNPDVAPLFLVSTSLDDVIFCIRKKTLWHQSTKLNDKKTVQFSLVTQSCLTLCDPQWTATAQASMSITNCWSLLKHMSTELMMPSNHLILCCSLLFPPSIFPSIRVFSSESVFTSGGQSIGVSASASVLPMNTQDWSPLGWTGGSPCCPRDSQESSPTPQFKSISSLALSFLYNPTLTSIHDYWKNYNLD